MCSSILIPILRGWSCGEVPPRLEILTTNPSQRSDPEIDDYVNTYFRDMDTTKMTLVRREAYDRG